MEVPELLELFTILAIHLELLVKCLHLLALDFLGLVDRYLEVEPQTMWQSGQVLRLLKTHCCLARPQRSALVQPYQVTSLRLLEDQRLPETYML